MDTINYKVAELALEHVNGSDFELFFQAFYPALTGINFVPLGGTGDGGADAFQAEDLFCGQPNVFYQASTQKDHRTKVRHTIERLFQSGRKPKVLHYVTSRTINQIDREEEKLTTEQEISIRLRDRKWITNNINQSPQTVEAFNSYLKPALAFLDDVLRAPVIETSSNLPILPICVFLGQQIDRRHGNTDLHEAVTDSLILWALEDTNPDKLMTRSEIRKKVQQALPSTRPFVKKVFDNRIRVLASKENPTGREIRWYKKTDRFCLPYETREVIKNENAEDLSLKYRILDLYKQRAATALETLEYDNSLSDTIAEIANRSLLLTFEKEGLELVEFLSGTADRDTQLTISDQVNEAIKEADLPDANTLPVKQVTMEVLRQAFYHSTEEERIYYGKLSRTYILLFTLSNEPRVIEYLKGISSHLVLFVGSDIIVRALSEMYLEPQDQMTINMCRILQEAGSTLILTRMVVEEVQAHLATTDYEFQNWFQEIEADIDEPIARQAGKILLRAYFYARNDPLLTKRPKSWQAFIEQFCTYRDLHSAGKSRSQIRDYLIEKFHLDYLDGDDLAGLTKEEEVQHLANRLKEIKSEDVLAFNDARQILGVYGKRRQLREDHKPNPYGYRTWWLTHETRVRQVTKDLIKAKGSEYIIRPEFVLNFIAFSPTTEQIRSSYNSIFPTLLGIRLSNRMRESIFYDTLKKLKEMREVDEPRAKAKMAEMSNILKTYSYQNVEIEFDEDFELSD